MSDENKKKYSIIRTFIKPYWIISDNFKTFFVQGSFFAVFMLLISYLFGQKYMCFFNKSLAKNMYCPDAFFLFFPYFIIKILAISVCIDVWYNSVFKKVSIDKNYFKNRIIDFLKIFGFICAFIVFNSTPLISSLILFFRVPNPVWQKELMFFTVVSVGFLMPFILMRFYSLFPVFLSGGNWKQFKSVWKATNGQTMKIVVSCALIFMVDLVILISVLGTFYQKGSLPAELYNASGEVVFAFVNYFIIISFLNFLEIQKDIFIDKN